MGSRYVGAMANRDPELMEDLKDSFKRFNVETVDIEADENFDETILGKYDISFLLPKLTTANSNAKLFEKLNKKGLQFLNSLKAVDICQSRRKIFSHIETHLPHLNVPTSYSDPKDIEIDGNEDKMIWVRRDAHNIPKEERVIGVTNSLDELNDLVEGHGPEELFYQEYLGERNEIYKVYVVGELVHCLKNTGPQDGYQKNSIISSEEIILPDHLRETMLEIGRKFDMNVYGVDFFFSSGVPVIIDINDFPSFRGIPDAPYTICKFVCERFLRDTESKCKQTGVIN